MPIFSSSKGKRTLKTSNSDLNIIAINGCCYGRDNKSDKGDYFKYCGQVFGEFISGNTDLYTEIIEPLGHKAKQKNEEFLISYSQMINKFTREFGNDFCKNNGAIDWVKLVKFNSSTNPLKRK
jgi:Type II restriction endonuclease EcoO109I